MANEHTVHVNGIDLHYAIDGAGPPLLLLHGGGVPGKSCTSGGEANWYERSFICHEERNIRRSRS